MKRLFPIYACALVGALCGPTARAGAPPTDAPGLTTWQLPNGLSVIFLPEHKAKVVTVEVFYHAGGKDEPADKRGIAHMFEHMMFKGSRHVRPEEHARFVDSVGGNENAFTSDDETGYYDTVPPSALDFTLKLEAERMRHLELTQKTIDSEREVVKEELRVRLENNPVMQALDKVLHLTYEKHPYRQFSIGEKRMLDTVTVEDCKKFYEAFYQPHNATLIVVGDTDEATVRRLVDQHFGPLNGGKRGSDPERPKVIEPPQTAARAATLSIPVQLPVVIGAYHVPDGTSADLYALDVLQRVLSTGESSRMYQRLVRKEKLAVAAGGFLFEHEDPGLFITYAAYLPGGEPEKIKKALAEEIAKVTEQPIAARELQKAKNQLAAQAVFRRERVQQMASQIGTDGIVAHDPLRAFHAAQKYDAVTAADVQRVAKKYLQASNLSMVTLAPKGASQ
jgi:zinc protease